VGALPEADSLGGLSPSAPINKRRTKHNPVKRRRGEQNKTVRLPVKKPVTATRLKQQDAESSAMKGTGKHYEQTH